MTHEKNTYYIIETRYVPNGFGIKQGHVEVLTEGEYFSNHSRYSYDQIKQNDFIHSYDIVRSIYRRSMEERYNNLWINTWVCDINQYNSSEVTALLCLVNNTENKEEVTEL